MPPRAPARAVSGAVWLRPHAERDEAGEVRHEQDPERPIQSERVQRPVEVDDDQRYRQRRAGHRERQDGEIVQHRPAGLARADDDVRREKPVTTTRVAEPAASSEALQGRQPDRTILEDLQIVVESPVSPSHPWPTLFIIDTSASRRRARVTTPSA